MILCLPLSSHSQGTGGDQANAIYLELERMGFRVSKLPLLIEMLSLSLSTFSYSHLLLVLRVLLQTYPSCRGAPRALALFGPRCGTTTALMT